MTWIKSFFLFILCLFCPAYGLSYKHIPNGYFTSIHILTVNPNEHLIIPVKASESELGRETVTNLAKSHGALAAVNGGFWELNGKPAGALKINHQWIGTPIKPRGAIGWSTANQKVLIDRVLTNYSLEKCPAEDLIEVIPVSIPPYTTSDEWNEVEHIVGGTPVLIRNGTIIEDFTPEQTRKSFLINRYPRTAVGIKENGDWIFVVVDSRFLGCFGGMTMKKLAEFMCNLGCVEALNLDGGESSTMVIENKVINEPYGKINENGKYVEAVSDAILIF